MTKTAKIRFLKTNTDGGFTAGSTTTIIVDYQYADRNEADVVSFVEGELEYNYNNVDLIYKEDYEITNINDLIRNKTTTKMVMIKVWDLSDELEESSNITTLCNTITPKSTYTCKLSHAAETIAEDYDGNQSELQGLINECLDKGPQLVDEWIGLEDMDSGLVIEISSN